MTYEKLDFIFPYFVLGYGALLTFVLNLPALQKIAERRFPAALNQQMNSHRTLGLICLVVGAVWSLQNIWFGPTFW